MVKTLVIYDDMCLFCQRTKRRFERFDWNKKLQWVGISKFDHKKYALKKDDLLKEIHVIDNDEVYKGFFAFKRMARCIPLLYPLYPLMLLPGSGWIGTRVYRWYAKHRYGI